MNRIKISPLAAVENELAQNGSAVRKPLEAVAGQVRVNSSPSSLFVPMHYEKNYGYPLIVWFHSQGADASEVHDIMPRLSMRNYVAVAPESPRVSQAADADNSEVSWGQDSRSIQLAHDALIDSVDKVKSRLNINPRRIYLAGFGAGATMAFRLAFERPELFAGVISLNGPVPTAATPLGQWDRSRKLPVFWAHCRKSQQFDQQQLCQQLRLLHIAGFSLTLRQYPGQESISDTLLGDVNRWIMEGVNTSPSNHPPQAK